MAKQWKNNVLTIQESKAGNLYIRVNENVTLEEGQNLVMTGKQESLDKSLKEGRIDEARHTELSEKLHFIKYEISVPPAEEA